MIDALVVMGKSFSRVTVNVIDVDCPGSMFPKLRAPDHASVTSLRPTVPLPTTPLPKLRDDDEMYCGVARPEIG